MKATPEQLRERWLTADGRGRREKILVALQIHHEWTTYLDGFPFVDEVLNGRDLRGINLVEKRLIGANLRRVNLHGANLYKTNLTAADLREGDLGESNCCRADFSVAYLNKADLGGADLRSAELFYCRLNQASFRFAFLGGANLFHAELGGADFHGAELAQTNLISAHLNGVKLTGSWLWETQRSGWSIQGVVCDYAYWDEEGVVKTEYGPGEFERLYSEKTKIVLHYQEGIEPIEYHSLPMLIQRLEGQHPGCRLRLKSIEMDAGGTTVTIAIDEFGNEDPVALQKKIEEEGKRYQAAIRELESKDLRIGELEQSLEQFKVRVFPFLLERVEKGAQKAVRKKERLTVMFLDLKGFSKMGEGERAEKLAILRGLAKPVLQFWEGVYLNTWGDAIMAGFLNPNDGVRCACRILKHMEVEGVRTRIGMNHGEVLVEHNAVTGRLDVVGNSVNLAARLEPIAEVGEVLVSEEVRYHTDVKEDLFEFKEVKRNLTKGAGGREAGDEMVCFAVGLRGDGG